MVDPIEAVNAGFPLPGPFPELPSVENGQVEIPNQSPGITVPGVDETDPDVHIPMPPSPSQAVDDATGDFPVRAVLGVGIVLAVVVALGQLFNINLG